MWASGGGHGDISTHWMVWAGGANQTPILLCRFDLAIRVVAARNTQINNEVSSLLIFEKLTRKWDSGGDERDIKYNTYYYIYLTRVKLQSTCVSGMRGYTF